MPPLDDSTLQLQQQQASASGTHGTVGRVSWPDPGCGILILNHTVCHSIRADIAFCSLQQILEAQVAEQRQQYQPTTMENVMSMLKSLLLRCMVIYVIMQLFRRPSTQPGNVQSEGTANRMQASNLYQDGTIMVSRQTCQTHLWNTRQPDSLTMKLNVFDNHDIFNLHATSLPPRTCTFTCQSRRLSVTSTIPSH